MVLLLYGVKLIPCVRLLYHDWGQFGKMWAANDISIDIYDAVWVTFVLIAVEFLVFTPLASAMWKGGDDRSQTLRNGSGAEADRLGSPET